MAETIVNVIFDILMALVKLLPMSPFLAMANSIEEFDFLGFLNYFIPFDNCLVLIQSWLVCVALYYIVKNLKKIVEFIKGFI